MKVTIWLGCERRLLDPDMDVGTIVKDTKLLFWIKNKTLYGRMKLSEESMGVDSEGPMIDEWIGETKMVKNEMMKYDRALWI